MQYDELKHYGILGMKWGVRRYQNEDGSLTPAGKKRYLTNGKLNNAGKKFISKRYEELASQAIAKYDKNYINEYIKAYNKAASDMNNGLIEKYNETWSKQHPNGDEYDEEYENGYADLFDRLVNKYMNESLADFYKNDEDVKRAEILVDKYQMLKWDEMAKANAKAIKEVYSEAERNIFEEDELKHYGILGMKWGKRNGPPYPLGGGDYSQSELSAIIRERHKHPRSIYNKRHFDEVIKSGTTLSTLSYDKDRTKDAEMFYATHKTLDKHQYNAMFNKPAPRDILDDDGNVVGTGNFLKWRINNKATEDIKVASEDSAAEQFRQLYANDRDFYNFVTDPDRMQSHFVSAKYGFKGYREARGSLEKIREGETPTDRDLQKVYRMFNYVVPSDGGGDERRANDVAKQRARFFSALKDKGYGAVLDTNDAIYGGFKATSPVIVFDQSKVALQGAEQTTLSEKRFSELVMIGRTALGI